MTALELDPHLMTVGELFDDPGATYTIPVYQRNFAWGAEQIELLISDIQGAIADKEDGYFLGNLIVTKRGTSRQPQQADYEVIDGQQRLTTLHLLLTILSDPETTLSPTHKGRLHYESRPRASATLNRIATQSARQTSAATDLASDEDPGILQGFNIIEQFIDQHINEARARSEFADFLRHQVTLVRATLPATTDLNRYFEVMNTRGQQLQQVDIVKARLMSRLHTDAQRACFAWVWDACADMDSYVQMALTPGNTTLRTEAFGQDWSWLQARDFTDLMRLWQMRALNRGSASAEPGLDADMSDGTSLTLDEALAKYEASGASAITDDPDNDRFKSTIVFPALLLHVLKVFDGDETEAEGQLDDRTLIKRFEQVFKDGTSERVQDFTFQLLRLRNLFDAFLLKRQYTAKSGEDGDWSMQRLIKRTSGKNPTPGYVNTFAAGSSEVDDDATDSATSSLLLIESMLRVTYTSPRTMHWITKLLRHLTQAEPGHVSGPELVKLLQDYSRSKVKEAFFASGEPQGFSIGRIVFTYLDYLLLQTQEPNPGFRFAFRNSIEHFYPQYADPQQSGPQVSAACLNLLGNLALVSVGANSKFSNSMPKAKAENFRTTIETQSPKLKLMAEITREGTVGRRAGARTPQRDGGATRSRPRCRGCRIGPARMLPTQTIERREFEATTATGDTAPWVDNPENQSCAAQRIGVFHIADPHR